MRCGDADEMFWTNSSEEESPPSCAPTSTPRAPQRTVVEIGAILVPGPSKENSSKSLSTPSTPQYRDAREVDEVVTTHSGGGLGFTPPGTPPSAQQEKKTALVIK
jgi:hypothetical protein